MAAAKNKYRNKKTTEFGIEFDSRREALRYVELRIMQAAGEIENIKVQHSFQLLPSMKKTKENTYWERSERGVVYIADFTYNKGGLLVVEDVKSPITRKSPAYVLKRKLMLYMHGISIVEIF